MLLPPPAAENRMCSIYYPELDNSPGLIINPRRKSTSGFTLIEMSIVLVIIALIVGGVLVGRDLISAAAVRAQITQIEKYNTAVNTFRGKYNNYLPGDIPNPDAMNFGFMARGQYAGEGDGNGVIEGVVCDAANCNYGIMQSRGETGAFWVDLSKANLIDGNFTTASTFADNGTVIGTAIAKFLPPGKIGRNNYVYAFSKGTADAFANDGVNYFGLSPLTLIAGGNSPVSNVGLTVAEAFNMDKKIDDGLPQMGRITAQYANATLQTNVAVWASGGGVQGANDGNLPPGPTTGATAGSSTTCYDNGGVAGTQHYSISQNNGTGVNCALSFKFQ